MTPEANLMIMDPKMVDGQFLYPSVMHNAYLKFKDENGHKYWTMKKIPKINDA